VSWAMTPSLRAYERKDRSPLRAWLRAERAADNLSRWRAAMPGWRPPETEEQVRAYGAEAVESMARRRAERDLREVLAECSHAFAVRLVRLVQEEVLGPVLSPAVIQRIQRLPGEVARPALFEEGPDETVHATGWTPRGA
jgi:hypothetical protein